MIGVAKPQLPPGGFPLNEEETTAGPSWKARRCSLLVDAEGADVMPSRPNEHASLGAPVRGCYHHLKCDWHTCPTGRRQLKSSRDLSPLSTLAAAKRDCEGACIPRLTLTETCEEALDNVVRAFRVCGGGARSSSVETATQAAPLHNPH